LVGWAIRTKNCCGHLQLILCCFLFNISLHTKFHSNLSENTKVENFRYWPVLVGRAGWSKSGLRYFKLILCCFGAIIGPHTKFHPNQTKNTEVENFCYWLVGLVGRKMIVGIPNSFYFVFGLLLAPIPNFIQIGRKTQKLKIFAIGRFWLVGLVGQKMVAATSNIRNLFRGSPMTFVQILNQIG